MISRDETPDPRDPARSNGTVAEPSAAEARGVPPWIYWLASAILATAGIWLLARTSATHESHDQPVQPSDRTTAQSSQQPPSRMPATPAATPTVTAPLSAKPNTFPTSDPLAGAIPDSLIQSYLDEAHLTNVAPATAAEARAAAWKDLAADLQTGGWTKPHLQASATTAAGANTNDPTAVDVVIIWSATDPAGQFTDRRQNTVRLLRTAPNTWTTDRIT
jgi:hypothetical protein